MIFDMWEDGWIGRSILLLFAALIVSIPFGIYAVFESDRQWQAFKVAHDCKVVGRMSGDTFTTVGPVIGGQGGVTIGIGSTPSKTGWQCNDGVTYWR